MAENFSLGKKGNFGNLDFNKLKSGVSKKDLGIENDTLLSTIFDKINTNKAKDGEEKLDKTELEILMQTIKALAGKDNVLSANEAKKFQLDGKNIGKEKEQLLQFLSKLSELTKGVQKVEQNEQAKSEIITYEDGRVEEVFQDGSKILTVTNGNKTTKTKFDKEGNITEETVTEGDLETVTEFVGGKKVKVVENNKANNTVTTTEFSADRKTKETVETATETTVINYGEDEAPVAKTVVNKENNGVETYSYEEGNFVLKSRTVPENNETITYSGTRETSVVDKDGVKTTVVKDGETVLSRKEETTNANGEKEVRETTFKGEDLTEEFSVDGKARSQRKVVNGQEYYVEYDETGENTKGVIVQNGESISKIAKKFNCSVADLIKLNAGVVKGKHPDVYFLVGQEIKVPGKLEADHPELINRKSASETKDDYEADAARRAEDARKAAEAAEAEAAKQAEEAKKKEISEGEREMALASAKTIVDELLGETKGMNNKKNIRAILSRIDNPVEYQEVNRLLAEKYPAEKMHSSLELYIKKELQRVASDESSEDLESLVKDWIAKGVIPEEEAVDAQARLAVRVIYDACDGAGTDCDMLKKGIYMIKAPAGQDSSVAPQVYEKVKALIKDVTGEDLEKYLKGEVWSKEIKYLDAILAENNALEGGDKVKASTDLFVKAVKNGGTNIEYLTQAVKSINSPEQRYAVEKELVKYCEENGVKAKIKGQSSLQVILYAECDKNMGISRNYDEIRKYNDMLINQGAYTEEQAVKIKAEQAAIQILECNFNNVLDAVQHIDDKAVLAKLNELLNTKGFDGLNDYLAKNFNKTSGNLVKAELASKNLLSNEEAVEVAFYLVQNNDYDARAKGLAAIRNEEVAKAVDAKLQEAGTSLADVVNQFNKDKAKCKVKAVLWDGVSKFAGFGERISEKYRENTDVSDNMYVEASAPQTISSEKKAAYDAAIKALEKDYNEAKLAYEKAKDDQGAFAWLINNRASQLNWGTTRDEIEANLEHNKETLRLLHLAADGKLAKMENGVAVAVSFEDVFNERQSTIITANGFSTEALRKTITKDEVTFDAAKTENVAKQGARMVAMNAVMEAVTVCWRDLESGQESGNVKQLSLGIYNAVKNIGGNIEDYGYKLNADGLLVKPDGKIATSSELQKLAIEIKDCLAQFTNEFLGENTVNKYCTSKSLVKMMDKAYDKNLEQFKEEYKAAFGTEPTDEMVDNYLKTINRGKIGVTITAAVVAVVLAPFTAGGSLAAVGGAASAGAAATATAGAASGISAAVASVSSAISSAVATVGGAVSSAASAIGVTSAVTAAGGALSSAAAYVGVTVSAEVASVAVAAAVNTTAATMGLSALENATDADGYTNKEWTDDLESAIWSGVTAAVGVGAGAYADDIAKAASQLRALGVEVSSDTIMSFAQAYCQEGKFNAKEFVKALAISIAANGLGRAISANTNTNVDGPKPEIEGPKPEVGTLDPKVNSASDDVLAVATADGTATSGGKLNADKMDLAREQVADVARQGTVDEVVDKSKQIDLHGQQSRVQARELQNVVADEVGFVRIGKERIDIETADLETLTRARRQVEKFSDSVRNKQALLDKIDARIGKLAKVEVPVSAVVDDAVDTKAFDDMFANSQFKITSSDQPKITVDRLGGAKFDRLKKELDDLCELAQTEDQLNMLRRRVESFRSDPQREAFLEIIENRRANLNSTPKPVAEAPVASVVDDAATPTPVARSSQIVEGLNASDAQRANNILGGQKGVLAPHDAALLDSHITNNLNTVEELEDFITKLKNRVGTYPDGRMTVYEVAGTDHAAVILKKAQAKIADLQAKAADFSNVKTHLANAKGRGLSNEEFAAVRSFVQKADSVDDLQVILNDLNGVKGSSQVRSLKKAIEDKIANIQTPKPVSVTLNSAVEPTPGAVDDVELLVVEPTPGAVDDVELLVVEPIPAAVDDVELLVVEPTPAAVDDAVEIVSVETPNVKKYFELPDNVEYQTNKGTYVKNTNTVTDFVPTTENVFIAADYTGHSVLAGKNTTGVTTDLVNLAYMADRYSVYDAKNNITIIGIGHSDAFGRAGSYNICVRGQISEADAAGLLDHLGSKGMLPERTSFKYNDSMQVRSQARQIQNEVVEYLAKPKTEIDVPVENMEVKPSSYDNYPPLYDPLDDAAMYHLLDIDDQGFGL